MKKLIKKSIAALMLVSLAATPIMVHADEAAYEYAEEAMEIGTDEIPSADEGFAPETDYMDPEAEADAEVTDDEEILDKEEPVLEDETSAARIALMSSIVDSAMDAHQDEGIYAALDSAFDALDANAEEFTDPETGRSEMTGDVIIETIYDSLDSHFDASHQEMIGAIGAAAARADGNDLIGNLEGNDTLRAMALEESADDYWNRTKQYYKAIYEGSIDAIAGVCPAFKPFAPLLKAMGGTIFAEGDVDHIAEIQADLAALTQKVTDSEQNLKDHMYNVVSIAMIGDKYNTVDDKAHTVLTLIKDIYDTDGWSDEKKLQDVADLYNNSEFQSLLSAMNGATKCFYSSSNDIFTNMNVFDAAYRTACETVMFSREALDISTPYIISQLATYTAAYSVMSEVYDAYQQVYGAGTLKESRRLMAERLYGQDLDGNKVGKSVSELVADYLSRDRYVFVNKSNTTAIPLNKDIYVCHRDNMTKNSIKSTYYYSSWCTTPDYMPANPLSQDQLKSIASYCADRNVTIFDFLFNDMKFEPDMLTAAQRKAGDMAPPPFNISTSLERGVYYLPTGSYVYGSVYLATGHSLDKHQAGERAWIDYTAINATKVGAKEETLKLAEASLNYYGNICGYSYYQNCPMFFQPR